MDERSRQWMAYIDEEVRAACEGKGWACQIRRKWSVRERPVVESPVDDYEWKLIPGASGRLPDQQPSDFDEGVYYVLSLDRRRKVFVLQHDTDRYGSIGPHFFHESYTEIRLAGLSNGDFEYVQRVEQLGDVATPESVPVPPRALGGHGLLRHGQLRDYLVELTDRFKPNHFSLT